jgi:putative transposase
MKKTYKYRLYPNKIQQQMLEEHFGAVRFLYNHMLFHKTSVYKKNKTSLNYYQTAMLLKELKQTESFSWLKNVNSQSLQGSLRNLDIAYQRFFKTKKGFPKFKSKKHKQSFQVPQHVKLENNILSIPKIKNIKIVAHRAIPKDANIKTVTISKTPTGKYFAAILIEDHKELPKKPKVSNVLGLDFGLTHLVITSDGNKIANPRCLNKSLERLKLLQQRLSSKQKGSKNKNKARLKVAKLHEKIANQRNDYLHKLSRRLCESQADTIAIEDLSIQKMMQNGNLAKSISDVAWHELRRQLEYKCEWYGKNLIVINKYFPSTKTCSACGAVNENLTLKNRIWNCPSCKATHDRDINAAINIAAQAGPERPSVPALKAGSHRL